MRYRTILMLSPILAIVLGCGGSEEPHLSVGGSYTTVVTLGANSCGPVTIQQQNTTVTHTAGSHTFLLSHHGNGYQGTLLDDGSFTTAVATFPDAVPPLSLAISGSFSLTGLSATVIVSQAGASPCQYTVTWIGPKQGAPNVIP